MSIEIPFGTRFTAATTPYIQNTDELQENLADYLYANKSGFTSISVPDSYEATKLARSILTLTKNRWEIARSTELAYTRCTLCVCDAGPDDQCIAAGTWPKRLANVAYKVFQVRLDPAFVGTLGEQARRGLNLNASGEGELYFDATDVIDWNAGDFGDDGSCFWDGRDHAKTMIGWAGGGAVRQWRDQRYHQGLSRCWIVPYGEGAVIFNAYGKLRLEQFATAIANAWQLKADPVESLSNNGSDTGMLYLNSGRGYYLHPEGTAKQESIDLRIAERQQEECPKCHRMVDLGTVQDFRGEMMCNGCRQQIERVEYRAQQERERAEREAHDARYVNCHRCHQDVERGTEIVSADTQRIYCTTCAQHYELHQCVVCGEWHGLTLHHGEINMVQVNGIWYCLNHQPEA